MPELLIDRVGPVVKLGLNRPERKNALTPEMYLQLRDAVDEANAREDVRAIVIHGNEAAFCSGNDMGNFAASNEAASTGQAPAERPSAGFMRSVVRLDKPLIASVNGPAVGIGATMLLHCDQVVAGSNAFLMFPFVKLGLCPEFASSLLLPALVGAQRATRLMLMGERCSAELARDLGLVGEIVSPEDSLARAMTVAEQLAGLSLDALKTTRRLIRPSKEALLERIEEENAEFARLLGSAEARAAFAAFREGRRG